MNNNVLPKRLKEIRESRGFSQSELAESVGISKTSLSAYELDKKKPSYEIVLKIAKVCRISMDWLCGLNECDNSLDNFGEFLKVFFKVIQSNAIELIKTTSWELHFNKIFSDFENAFFETFNLYKNGIINKELFSLWCNNEIKKYKNISINKELDRYGTFKINGINVRRSEDVKQILENSEKYRL